MAAETVAVGDVRLAQEGVVEAVGCALSLGDPARAEELVATLSERFPRPMTPVVQAQTMRLRARIAAAEGSGDDAHDGFKAAVGMFREVRAPFWLAVTLLEHGEWLLRRGRAGEAGPALEEAREIFGRLGATPWLERLEGATGAVLSVEPTSG